MIVTIEHIEHNSHDGAFYVPKAAKVPKHVENYARFRNIKLVYPTDVESTAHHSTCPSCVTLAVEEKDHPSGNRVIISCAGVDKPGIIAAITTTICDSGLSIGDISQKIMGNFFTLVLVADLDGLRKKGLTFKQFKDRVVQTGKRLDLDVMVTHERIVKVMQRI